MHRYLKKILLASAVVFLSSCNQECEINNVLQMAGENRKELIKVLAHYRPNESDSLKYKAALYLIQNMGGHYTLSNPNQHKVDSIKQRYLKQGYLDKQSIEMLDANNAFNYLLDAKSINSSFLIKNIDEAFETWGKRPWSKHISFHSFCEYILPYRIDNEALEDWRELYHNRYSFLLDSLFIFFILQSY